MIRIILKILKYSFLTVVSLLVAMILYGVYLYHSADRSVPDIRIPEPVPQVIVADGYSQYDSSVLRLNRPGLWELHLKGDAAERGMAFGQLCKDLMYEQEKAFVTQIRRLVPSDNYLTFLKYITIIYNRNIAKNIPEEYRDEIYASSFACSHEYDFIGNAYDRQLNYHAAHDLGHAMQEYMLVGCSSFGVWGGASQDSSLIIGRNFDFYVGEDFAKNKIVTFFYPDKGYKFASIGWAGMVGVLSGMNETGLTVTMNAAKSAPPTSSKTPISIIARKILQYSSNIQEAYQIARSMDAFVSESLLIGSANDGIAAIIEKSPENTILYKVNGEVLISTNHFQSKEFLNNKDNDDAVKSIEGSHSLYRFNRLSELIREKGKITPLKAAEILRDPYGSGGRSIGLTNEKSINQFIAHHSVIFEPKKRMMWVSTDPWQLGEMVAYNLDSVFKKRNFNSSSDIVSLKIPRDSIMLNGVYKNVVKFKLLAGVIADAVKNKKRVPEYKLRELVECNPDYYYSYELIGNYYLSSGDKGTAIEMYQESLKRELPSNGVKKDIYGKINKLKKR